MDILLPLDEILGCVELHEEWVSLGITAAKGFESPSHCALNLRLTIRWWKLTAYSITAKNRVSETVHSMCLFAYSIRWKWWDPSRLQTSLLSGLRSSRTSPQVAGQGASAVDDSDCPNKRRFCHNKRIKCIADTGAWRSTSAGVSGALGENGFNYICNLRWWCCCFCCYWCCCFGWGSNFIDFL